MADITALEMPPPVTKVLLIGTVAVTLWVSVVWSVANEQVGGGGPLAAAMGECCTAKGIRETSSN